MNEATIRLELSHALQWHGYWPKHQQDGRLYFCKMRHPVLVVSEQKGLPDIEARHPKYPSVMIEVKDVPKTSQSFAFDEIEPEQRNYLSKWESQGGLSYICIGKIVAAGSRSKLHGISVIPWYAWLEFEDMWGKSAPYDQSLYAKRQNWPEVASGDIISLAEEYLGNLIKVDKDWRFQESHPIVHETVDIPYFRKEKRDIHESIKIPPADNASNADAVVH